MANTCQAHSAQPELELHRTSSGTTARMDGFVRSPIGRGRDGLLGRHRPALLLRAGEDVPAVRPLVRVVPRPDVPEPPVPAVRLRARQHQHERRPERRTRRRRTARSSRPSTGTASRGATTTRRCPSLFLFPSVFGKQRRQVPQARPVLRRRGRGQAAVRSASSNRTARRRSRRTRRTSRWARRSPPRS